MEIWDLYTSERAKTGDIHIRGVEIPDEKFHLVVHVWLRDEYGRYLLTQRAATRKHMPLVWECTCGSVLVGESSLQGAMREISEEVGVALHNNGTIIHQDIRREFLGRKYNDLLDVWVFPHTGEIDLGRATTKEVCDVKWLYPVQIMELWRAGEVNPELEYFFSKVEKVG